MSCKNCNQKSALRLYNTASQNTTASGTQLILLGNKCTDTGVSLTAGTNSVTVNSRGLYYIAADVVLNGTAAGTANIQFTNNGSVLPCALASITTVADTTYSAHIETEVCLTPCCAITPNIGVLISGITTEVAFIGMTMEKRA